MHRNTQLSKKFAFIPRNNKIHFLQYVSRVLQFKYIFKLYNSQLSKSGCLYIKYMKLKYSFVYNIFLLFKMVKTVNSKLIHAFIQDMLS